MSTETFLQEYESTTEPNPLNCLERVWGVKAVLSMAVSGFDNAICLRGIRSVVRRQGDGSLALEYVLRMADKHKVDMYLEVCPTGTAKPRLPARDLTKWYERHGFKKMFHGMMVYKHDPVFIRCDQCQACMIQGVMCHETGCPNMRKKWNPATEKFESLVRCCCGDIHFESEGDCHEEDGGLE